MANIQLDCKYFCRHRSISKVTIKYIFKNKIAPTNCFCSADPKIMTWQSIVLFYVISALTMLQLSLFSSNGVSVNRNVLTPDTREP